MIKVAIVDDADVICHSIEEFLNTYSRNNKLRIEYDSYYSGNEAIQMLNTHYYDLVFLDIEIGEKNGIDVSMYLRENLGNETTEIIYVSSHSQYAVDLFDYDPITFLTKPIDVEKLERAFKKFLKRLNINKEIFAFKNGKGVFRIHFKDILYFESFDHKIVLHTLTEQYEFYDKMDRLILLLKTQKFLSVHRSFLVNSTHIRKYEYASVTMDNGIVIPIAQSKRKTIRELQLENDEGMGWDL